MRVIIAGDREMKDIDLIETAINKSGFKITELVSGCARGADKMGELWARANGVPIKQFKANWDDIKAEGARIKTRENPWTKKMEKYNARAGFQRNEEMAQYAEALIALQPNGPTDGTQDMIKRAKEHELEIFVYEKADEDYEYKF